MHVSSRSVSSCDTIVKDVFPVNVRYTRIQNLDNPHSNALMQTNPALYRDIIHISVSLKNKLQNCRLFTWFLVLNMSDHFIYFC